MCATSQLWNCPLPFSAESGFERETESIWNRRFLPIAALTVSIGNATLSWPGGKKIRTLCGRIRQNAGNSLWDLPWNQVEPIFTANQARRDGGRRLFLNRSGPWIFSRIWVRLKRSGRGG